MGHKMKAPIQVTRLSRRSARSTYSHLTWVGPNKKEFPQTFWCFVHPHAQKNNKKALFCNQKMAQRSDSWSQKKIMTLDLSPKARPMITPNCTRARPSGRSVWWKAPINFHSSRRMELSTWQNLQIATPEEVKCDHMHRCLGMSIYRDM